jgi:hypothetical protein
MVETIELVLIDQQSVGKRSLNLMDSVNAKKRWTTIYWRVNKFLLKSEHHFSKINDTNVISFFGTPDSHHCFSVA